MEHAPSKKGKRISFLHVALSSATVHPYVALRILNFVGRPLISKIFSVWRLAGIERGVGLPALKSLECWSACQAVVACQAVALTSLECCQAWQLRLASDRWGECLAGLESPC